MCGILGVLGKLPPESIIGKARDTIAHRGPDDAGLYFNESDGVALAHRRLSIIDLTSAGHQPFFSNDKRYVLIFKGEIYNYLEIKDELRDFYDFKTKTDTEVLLASYIKWGEQCLNKFNGMYVFAIWDIHEKKLFCARDRLGVKPLFYYCSQDSVYFSSEIKGLMALEITPAANEDMIYDYLKFGLYDHTDETFFKDIKMLPAGHYFTWHSSVPNKLQIRQYWNLKNNPRDFSGITEGDIIEEFKNLIADSIKLRFRSDVPVGLNLSSGLDSNSLLFYSRKVTGNEFHKFSMCLEDEKYDECRIIDGFLGSEQKKFWHTGTLKPEEVIYLAEKMNEIQDQPYGGFPTILYAKLNESAKNHGVTVLLEGQGMDELLAGYKYYLFEYEKDMELGALDTEGMQSSIKMSQDMTSLVYEETLNKDFLGRGAQRALSFENPFGSNLLNAQYRDIVYTKIPRVLRFNDHVSMAFSRELRLPYLDYRLVEFCFYLPHKFKIRNGVQKFLMREAMKDVLPSFVKDKPKKAFGAFQGAWLKKYFRDWVFTTINSPSFKGRGYFENKDLNIKVKNFFDGKIDNSFFIWQCINLEMWFNRFISK